MAKAGDLFSEERVLVQKVFIREKNPLSKLSPQNIQIIKNNYVYLAVLRYAHTWLALHSARYCPNLKYY